MNSDSCFYCDQAITDTDSFHPISFFYHEEELEKKLCPECYKEWLEGIKE